MTLVTCVTCGKQSERRPPPDQYCPHCGPALRFSECDECDKLIASTIAIAEEGWEEHASMSRDDPDYDFYMAPHIWDLAFAEAILVTHEERCPVWVAEHGQQPIQWKAPNL